MTFKKVHLHKTGNELQHIDIEIIPRKNSLPLCPKCGQKCPTYDTNITPRRFDFVPLWNIPVFFPYKNIAAKMRRCFCNEHGITTEHVPWSDGKETSTLEHRQFLANWTKRMSWSEVAECFQTTFSKEERAVAWLVE